MPGPQVSPAVTEDQLPEPSRFQAQGLLAMKESLSSHVRTTGADNPADLETKVITGGQKHNHMVGKLLCNVCDDH